MIKATFELEKKLLSEGYKFVIGIDEAGRGPLAGPVVAAAVVLRNLEFRISNFESNPNDIILNDKMLNLIRDSKTLSEEQRESLFDFIHEHFFVGVGICDHETIDRMNILEATYLAMKKAVSNLMKNLKFPLPLTPSPDGRGWISPRNPGEGKIQDTKYIMLIDGNKPIPNLTVEQKAIVNGDKHVKSISAASIIAKVTRDRIMLEMHQKYPEYGFDKHKGYGTNLHLECLRKYGSCKIHRSSFRPVKEASRA